VNLKTEMKAQQSILERKKSALLLIRHGRLINWWQTFRKRAGGRRRHRTAS